MPRAFFLFHFSVHLHPDGVKLSAKEIRCTVQNALAEDIGSGDATTLAIVSEAATARAVMRAREPLIVAGLDIAKTALCKLSAAVKVERLVRDGRRVVAGENLLRVSGPARAILSAERVALNFVQRLSGMATLTAQFADAIKGTHTTYSIRAKPRPACGVLKNTPSPAVAEKIIASVCTTWFSSRTIILLCCKMKNQTPSPPLSARA